VNENGRHGQEAGPTPWRAAAGVAVCLLFAWFSIARDVRVPLLGPVDLGFHELGHLLTYPFPDVVTAAMGSIAQIAVPLGLASYFLIARDDLVGGGTCLAWAGTAARDVAVYVADAPVERLELIGGEHDWAFLLGPGHLDALDAAATIAAVVRVTGTILVVGGIACCAWELFRAMPRRETPGSRVSVPDLGFGGRGGS
jgi:hypothetical protein